MKMLIEKYGYFIDENNNRWSIEFYTLESATKKSESLNNCLNCFNCSGCSYCSRCSYCSGCFNCSDCSGCSYCSGCSRCSHCSDCSGCSGCSGFKENPQRLTSSKIGSRNSQTTVYWTDDKEEVICGCFKGTLDKFKIRVIEKHGNNEYAKQYLTFIEKVQHCQSPLG